MEEPIREESTIYGSEETPEEGQQLQKQNVLLLQFQLQFQWMIMLGVFVSYASTLMDITFAFSTEKENIPHEYSSIAMGKKLIPLRQKSPFDRYSVMFIGFLYCMDVVYLVDTLLMISYKETQCASIINIYPTKPSFFTFLDIVSLIPVDPACYTLDVAGMRLIYILRLRYMLRIFTLVHKVRNLRKTVGYNHVLVETVSFCFILLFYLLTYTCLVYYIRCQAKACGFKNWKTFFKTFHHVTSHVSAAGIHDKKGLISIEYPLLFYVIDALSFTIVQGCGTALILIAIAYGLRNQHLFDKLSYQIVRDMRRNGCEDELVISTGKQYFGLMWKYRRGFPNEKYNKSILPEIMVKEINLEMYWDCLRHSNLFRNRDVYFLRYVSSFVVLRYMLPGQVIFRRGELKSAMIYVADGVIQVLSERDGETSIVSFSRATCLGETSLVVDNPSVCTVVCYNYCELCVLYKRDFMKIIRQFPEECRAIFNEVTNRYVDARKTEKYLDVTFNDENGSREVFALKWLKFVFKDLMPGNKKKSEVTKTLSLEERRVRRLIDDNLYCATYLDMLVIRDSELSTDTVFAKTSCPCIIQPDSFVISTWNNIITLVLLAYLFVYPYFGAFEPATPHWYFFLSFIVSFLWFCDVYIILSTAIRTGHIVVKEFREIVSIQITEMSFIVDVLAVIPVEMLAILMVGQLSSQAIVLLQASRLLKVHKLNRLLNNVLHRTEAVKVAYIKYSLYFVLLTYYFAALLHLNVCYNNECATDNRYYNFVKRFSGDDKRKTFVMWVVVVGSGMSHLYISLKAAGTIDSIYVLLIFINVTSIIFFVCCVSKIGALLSLKNYNKSKVKEHIKNIKIALKALNVTPTLQEKVMKHITGQLQYNDGFNFLYSHAELKKLFHEEITKEAQDSIFNAQIKNFSLFRGLPNSLIKSIALSVHPHLVAPGEILTYTGEICSEMHIITSGHCAIVSPSGKILQVLEAGNGVSAIEMCFQIPIANTVITLTHCQVSTILYEDYMKAFRNYPRVLEELNKIINETAEIANLDIYDSQNSGEFDYSKCKKEKNSSFKIFGYKLSRESKTGIDYYEYLEKVKYLSFLKFFLLRITIRPYGTFLVYWEISRCIFAFLTCILSPITFISLCSHCYWPYFLYFLDFTAWLDIYVRHHICYFNYIGLEVTHPMKTAVHYWKNAFFVDLMGVLPFELILPNLIGMTKNNRIVFLKLGRLLQTYRIWCGMKQIRSVDENSNIVKLVKYFPSLLLVVLTMASLNVNLLCNFNENIPAKGIYAKGVTCASSRLETLDIAKPISPSRVHFYLAFYYVRVILKPVFGNATTFTYEHAIVTMLWSIFGFMLSIWVTASILSTGVFINSNLIWYQEAMKHLLAFLSLRRIDPKLRAVMIEHYEYKWNKLPSQNLRFLIEATFNRALKEDLLYEVYGPTLKEHTIFKEASSAFLRSILLNVHHRVFINRGIITQVNNVHSDIYIVFKGQVEVLGPDYNRLVTLPIGSLFGNVDTCSMSRQTLSMVAKGHVEVLIIPSKVFHDILSKYSRLNHSYNKLITLNTDYISSDLSQFNSEMFVGRRQTVSASTATSFKSKSQNDAFAELYCKQFDFFLFVRYWQIVVLTCVHYTGSVILIYQLSTLDHSSLIFTILYTIDFLFLVNIIIEMITPVQDKFGIFITNNKQILIEYVKNSKHLFLSISSLLPTELFSFIFFNSSWFWTVWSYCRINRLIRIIFLLSYFRKRRNQLNINIITFQIIEEFVVITLILQGFTWMILVLGCITPTFNTNPLTNCFESSTIGKIKFYFSGNNYMTKLFLSVYLGDVLINAVHLLIYFICVIPIGRILTSMYIKDIISTADTVNSEKYQYEHNMLILRQTISGKWTSPDLRERIFAYVRLLWYKNQGSQFPKFVKEAPYYLREAVMNSMFGFHLRKHPVFGACHKDLLRQMAAEMETRIYFSGDNIVFINDIDGCMYFIHEGSIDALSEDDVMSSTIDFTYNKGDTFGLKEGIYKQKRHEFTYKANRYSIIIVLERARWIHLLDFFPASRQTIYNRTQ